MEALQNSIHKTKIETVLTCLPVASGDWENPDSRIVKISEQNYFGYNNNSNNNDNNNKPIK